MQLWKTIEFASIPSEQVFDSEANSMGVNIAPYCFGQRGGHFVRLPEDYRKCVALIGTGSVGAEAEIAPWGTGFLVGVDLPKSGFIYLVTAAHVVSERLDCPFDVRLNRRDGGAQNLHFEEPNWHLHPTDPTVDVAVHPIEMPSWADWSCIPDRPTLLMPDRIESKDIGAGNRTYTVGLFKFLHGDRRNQPFVYTGHIGLVPQDQRIPVKAWLPEHRNKRVLVEAYLVEGEPLDGASGSPVFVRRTLEQCAIPPEGGAPVRIWVEGTVWVLGLLSDAFRAKPGEDYDVRGEGMIPRGVNVVVPAQKIMQVLDHPALVAAREANAAEKLEREMPMKASVSPTTADNPRHKEDFTALLGAAAKGKSEGSGT